MEIVEFGRLSDAHRAELEGDEVDPFDVAHLAAMRFRPKERHVALRDADGRLVASTGMVVCDVEVAGERFAVVGIGGVIVAAEHRGRGLARRVVGEALTRASELGPDLALLFCLDDRAGLYERLGFATVAAPVSVEQPGGVVRMPLRAMWRGLHPGAAWPPGEVAVRGLPY